jgi:hypothetical protein
MRALMSWSALGPPGALSEGWGQFRREHQKLEPVIVVLSGRLGCSAVSFGSVDIQNYCEDRGSRPLVRRRGSHIV